MTIPSGIRVSMTGNNLNLSFLQGKTIDFTVTYGPVDLSGHTARFMARDSAGAVLADLTTENGGLIIDGPAGEIKLTMSAVDSALLDPAKPGRHELELYTPGGSTHRVFAGNFSVEGEVVS